MNKIINCSILIAGSSGMVGSAILNLLNNNLQKRNLTNNKIFAPTRNELDYRDTKSVFNWFKINKPSIVIIAAAKVGGIIANNSNPTAFLIDNLRIQNNLIEASFRYGVKRLLFLGSSCIYPKNTKQPIKEEYLLTGLLEPTNESYAIAKIAGIKLCEAYRKEHGFDAISLMPTNLYGPGDNYSYNSSHVLPALIRKFDEAKDNNLKFVNCLGTGTPFREFLYVDDLAEACIFVLENWYPSSKNFGNQKVTEELPWLNVGSNEEITIKSLAIKISNLLGFQGEIIWNEDQPDGTPRKRLDSSKINKLGWKAKTNLDDGIQKTIMNYKLLKSQNKLRIS